MAHSTRLPGPRYQHIFDEGRSKKGRLMVAWQVSSPDADLEAGVVVSKKTFHHAVLRNRAKRLLRESFRLLVKAQQVPMNSQWIFVARRAIEGRTESEVREEMQKLCAES